MPALAGSAPRRDVGPPCAEGHLLRRDAALSFGGADRRAMVDFAQTTFHFEMHVDRIDEARITRPFADGVGPGSTRWRWSTATRQRRTPDDGRRADFRVDRRFQSDEWNTAVGLTKKGRTADRPIRRLREAFGPGGMLHYGRGKWYPGEKPAAGALGLYWRGRRQADLARRGSDGAPVEDPPP